MTALDVRITAKSFGTVDVLKDVAFRLEPGEVGALLGPSGSGKSTLLNLIAGLDRDFDGAVTAPEGRVAMVFQAPRLLPWRTLAQNVALAGSIDLPEARCLLQSVGLAGAEDQFPEKASLGMQRRASLARALAVNPGLVLMDEPLVSLDHENAMLMRKLIRTRLANTGAAALITTHDRHEALSLADRILEIGGSPATLMSDRRSPLNRAERTSPSRITELVRDWFGDDQGAGASHPL